MEQELKVKSLAKAVKLLECFSTRQPELGVTELAKMLGLQKSTVHNIASSFLQLGYLSQNKETGKYFLGVKLLQFSYIINNHMGLRNFFLPYMNQIAAHTNENVFLGIPHEADVLYLECQFPSGSLLSRNILGERAHMYCTGLGKAMLAFLPEEERVRIASLPMERFTDNTILDKQVLLDDLEVVRKRGYSIDFMEHEYGVICIGVPIFGNDKRVVAALSTSAPSLRFDEKTIADYALFMQKLLEPAQYVL